MIINVITSLHPAIHPILSDGLNTLAKSTPVMTIAVAAKPAFLQLLFQVGIASLSVLSDEVIFEALATVANFRASIVLTRPRLELEVLTAFMPFPVVLGAEFLLTTFERTAVWFLMTLPMFFQFTLTRKTLVTVFTREETPGISHVFLGAVCFVI